MRHLNIQSIYDKNGNEILDRRSERQTISFNVSHNKGKSTCYLFEDQGEDKIWILSTGSCIKAIYTEADYAEGERLSKELPINHGDIVRIKGRGDKEFSVHVNGAYSDVGYLVPIN
jgi:hypothetical protein